MYVCTYAHVCMYVHMLMYVCTYAHVCMYVYRDCTISMFKTRCTETSKEPIFFLQMTEQSSWVSVCVWEGGYEKGAGLYVCTCVGVLGDGWL